MDRWLYCQFFGVACRCSEAVRILPRVTLIITSTLCESLTSILEVSKDNVVNMEMIPSYKKVGVLPHREPGDTILKAWLEGFANGSHAI